MQENGFARIEDIPTATLRTWVLNHMIALSAFPVGYVPTMAEVKTAARKAQVEDKDIRATNAILHNTDRILLPL